VSDISLNSRQVGYRYLDIIVKTETTEVELSMLDIEQVKSTIEQLESDIDWLKDWVCRRSGG
jgi:hypothetical protein